MKAPHRLSESRRRRVTLLWFLLIVTYFALFYFDFSWFFSCEI